MTIVRVELGGTRMEFVPDNVLVNTFNEFVLGLNRKTSVGLPRSTEDTLKK